MALRIGNLVLFIGFLAFAAWLVLYINRPMPVGQGRAMEAGCPIPIVAWEGGTLKSFSFLGLFVDHVCPLGALAVMGVVAVPSFYRRAMSADGDPSIARQAAPKTSGDSRPPLAEEKHA
jgi:hypothetical protein